MLFGSSRRSIRRANRFAGMPGKREKPRADDEEAAVEKFVLAAGVTDVPIEARCIRGNTGLAASDFVQSIKADLLVVPLEKSAGATQQLAE